jgi:hypothetical protein
MAKLNAAFWKWFGESKVVDSKGRPLVVYHGTSIKKTRFRRERGMGGMGAYFTSSKKEAEVYAEDDASIDGGTPIVMPVYLSLQNPYRVAFHFDRSTYDENADPQAISETFMDRLESSGYDGIIITNTNEYVAFYPEQIKSAVKNDGTWDADDPNIGSNPDPLEYFSPVRRVMAAEPPKELFHRTRIEQAIGILENGFFLGPLCVSEDPDLPMAEFGRIVFVLDTELILGMGFKILPVPMHGWQETEWRIFNPEASVSLWFHDNEAGAWVKIHNQKTVKIPLDAIKFVGWVRRGRKYDDSVWGQKSYWDESKKKLTALCGNMRIPFGEWKWREHWAHNPSDGLGEA